MISNLAEPGVVRAAGLSSPAARGSAATPPRAARRAATGAAATGWFAWRVFPTEAIGKFPPLFPNEHSPLTFAHSPVAPTQSPFLKRGPVDYTREP